jgi:RimJ/RimL family protein N-acetyltransferase
MIAGASRERGGLSTLAGFVQQVAELTGRPASSLDADADLERDLGFDPVERYLLRRAVLDGGVAFDEARFASIATLGEAHRLVAVEQVTGSIGRPIDLRSGSSPERERPELPMRGDAVWLRVPTNADLDWIHALVTHPVNLAWAPLCGQTRSPADLTALLAATSLCQYVIADNERGRSCGWVRAASADVHNGHAYLEAVLDPDLWDAGWPLEGVEMAVEQLFSSWRLRKVYLEIPGPHWALLSEGTRGRLGRQGVLVRHRYAQGEWHDVHLCALDNASWAQRFSYR